MCPLFLLFSPFFSFFLRFVKDSKVFFNSTTNNAVVLDASGGFVTGFKLSPGTQQFDNFVKNGVLR
ncbi:hypothetical protein OC929_04005 [Pseudomonas peradeniyensis]|uniref:Uncharacterized protein n=1 Tax=Pseudomonas peradeniyensis TaxID=2745488 RepID=A0ABT2V675_9PSED|nr:hypothetical protein [Pseudomonas peradeniyensis]